MNVYRIALQKESFPNHVCTAVTVGAFISDFREKPAFARWLIKQYEALVRYAERVRLPLGVGSNVQITAVSSISRLL